VRQPVIGLDVDDVVADLLTPWFGHYARIIVERGLERDEKTPDDLTGWHFGGQVKYPELFMDCLKEVDYQKEVRPIAGALAAVEELRKLGRVIFVTSCPELYSAQPKYRWLQQHGFLPADGSGQVDYFPVRDKKMVRMDYLFDDAEHNIKSCADAGITTILVRRPHNRNFEWDHNVPGLYAAPGYLKQLMGV
jgi:5'(3')-deoxyribonucleotidase